MTKIDFLFRQVDTMLVWYKQSEDKTKFLITINTAVVTVASSLVFVSSGKTHAAELLLDGQVSALLLVLVSLLLSFGCILRAVWAPAWLMQTRWLHLTLAWLLFTTGFGLWLWCFLL
jgi:hypothetical protein